MNESPKPNPPGSITPLIRFPPVVSPHQPVPRCIGCEYPLTGLTADRCPECGLAFDFSNAPPIPWTRRREVGLFRALWATASMAVRRPGMLAAEMLRPVDHRDARSFRRTVAVVTGLPAAIWPALLAWMALGRSTAMPGTVLQPGGFLLPPYWEVAAAALFGLCAVPFANSILRIGTVFFRVRGLTPIKRNRAVAVRQYAAGPYLYLILGHLVPIVHALVLWTKSWIAVEPVRGRSIEIALLTGVISVGAAFVVTGLLCLRTALAVLRRAAPETGRTVLFGFSAVLWPAFAAVLYFGVVPIAVVYTLLVGWGLLR